MRNPKHGIGLKKIGCGETSFVAGRGYLAPSMSVSRDQSTGFFQITE